MSPRSRAGGLPSLQGLSLTADDRTSSPPLTVQNPQSKRDTEDEKNRNCGGPLFRAATEAGEIVTQLENARFQCFAASQRMKDVRVGLEPFSIRGLQSA